MYKRIEQKIKDAEYERDMQEVLEILNDNREKHLQSKDKIEIPSEEPREIQYSEKQIKVSTCRLCNVEFKGTAQAANKHLESEVHKTKLVEYKKRYGNYIYKIRKQIFKNKLSNHSKLNKLKLFRLAYEFE